MPPRVPPPPAPRGESREVVELRALRIRRPELADAVDLHLELVELGRRLLPRIPVPSLELNATLVAWHDARQQPMLRFEDIPVETSDLRLMVRQTADVLHRHGILDVPGHQEASALARDIALLERAKTWYTAPRPTGDDASLAAGALSESVAQTLSLALRPHLSRCAEVIRSSPHLSSWTHATCPLCGGEADFAVMTGPSTRDLLCSRCSLRWAFATDQCPFCASRDATRRTSFSTPDGVYLVVGCQACQRYLKAADERRLGRPVLPITDGVATLPLDAAAIQQGYLG